MLGRHLRILRLLNTLFKYRIQVGLRLKRKASTRLDAGPSNEQLDFYLDFFNRV